MYFRALLSVLVEENKQTNKALHIMALIFKGSQAQQKRKFFRPKSEALYTFQLYVYKKENIYSNKKDCNCAIAVWKNQGRYMLNISLLFHPF